jgi:hypothetical protein
MAQKLLNRGLSIPKSLYVVVRSKRLNNRWRNLGIRHRRKGSFDLRLALGCLCETMSFTMVAASCPRSSRSAGTLSYVDSDPRGWGSLSNWGMYFSAMTVSVSINLRIGWLTSN